MNIHNPISASPPAHMDGAALRFISDESESAPRTSRVQSVAMETVATLLGTRRLLPVYTSFRTAPPEVYMPDVSTQ